MAVDIGREQPTTVSQPVFSMSNNLILPIVREWQPVGSERIPLSMIVRFDGSLSLYISCTTVLGRHSLPHKSATDLQRSTTILKINTALL